MRPPGFDEDTENPSLAKDRPGSGNVTPEAISRSHGLPRWSLLCIACRGVPDVQLKPQSLWALGQYLPLEGGTANTSRVLRIWWSPGLPSYRTGGESQPEPAEARAFLCAVSLGAGGSPRHCQYWGQVALWGGTVPGTVWEPAAFQDPIHWMPQGPPSCGNGQCPPMSASVPGRRTTPGQNSRVELQAARGGGAPLLP